ncbi:putative plant lipid transfer protein/Par allergen [Medicago truncatula]|uniref:Putative plant lipid transfer protein/Par allergen n=1 Tax=Medicago truncatula TaxID=3880 RepID=A0A396GZX9_MEDTR|nr:non-specific lipid-transfer protein 2 [Medicago truncatula]RHN46672.1 putative plant lipid transfer protein/Par allergen [Medicago truncatula]
MASSILVKVTCLAMICLVLSIPLANAVITCPDADITLKSCLPYVAHPTQWPPLECCTAVLGLTARAVTREDRQAVCKCLLGLMNGIPGLDLTAFAAVPILCAANIGYIIRPNMDCNSVP